MAMYGIIGAMCTQKNPTWKSPRARYTRNSQPQIGTAGRLIEPQRARNDSRR